MNVVVKRKEETDFSFEQIVNLLHESFQERLLQGLKFTCSYMTIDEFKSITSDGIIFIAVDLDSNSLVGTATIHIRKDSEDIVYGYLELLAINENTKRCGIGSSLFATCENVVKNAGGEYILSDTAVGAKSSVKYHLKNGFKIIGLRSFASTDYYSYLFRKQLVPSKKWNSDIYCKFLFLKTSIRERVCFNKNGSYTFLYSLYKRVWK